MGEKVVGYVRVSTEGQVRDGDCKENELQMIHIFEDKGISGAIEDEKVQFILNLQSSSS
ncbi:recombinase family protein [Bacillus thuringiensis]|uniref:recombinase family protein n=1 Tax=Bacillus thuringiensis TaxID=1428 RepID=UPI002224C787|nr:recombinase family protein [Bacillus thuringiensis]